MIKKILVYARAGSHVHWAVTVPRTETFLTAVMPGQNCLSKHSDNGKQHQRSEERESFAARSKRITHGEMGIIVSGALGPCWTVPVGEAAAPHCSCRSFPCWNSHSGLQLEPVCTIWQSFSPDLSSCCDFRYLIFATSTNKLIYSNWKLLSCLTTIQGFCFWLILLCLTKSLIQSSCSLKRCFITRVRYFTDTQQDFLEHDSPEAQFPILLYGAAKWFTLLLL